jgi:hypothetical protein
MRRRVAAPACAAALVAAAAPSSAGARPLLLPSPTTPLDARVPLQSQAPPTEQTLPLNAGMASRERVAADVLADGTVVGVRVVQRLTLTGTGEYFFTVPAPLRDARAGPGSQSEPGFRRSGVIWQGFANRRRVLVADADLLPGPAAQALPLRLELRATVDGQPLASGERRSGRLRLELRLRNATAVRTQAFSARPVSRAAVRTIAARIAAQVRRGETPDQPVLEVRGPIRPRTVTVDAPLVVAGEVRLPTRGLGRPVVRGGSLARRAGSVALRFRLVLDGPARSSATIALTGSVRAAGFPRAVLTAEPSAAAVVATGAGRGSPQATADAAGLMLLGLARVRQYDAFLANPAPGGTVHAVYSFRTVEPSATAATPTASDEGGGVARPVLVLLLALLGAAALAVLWAHL